MLIITLECGKVEEFCFFNSNPFACWLYLSGVAGSLHSYKVICPADQLGFRGWRKTSIHSISYSMCWARGSKVRWEAQEEKWMEGPPGWLGVEDSESVAVITGLAEKNEQTHLTEKVEQRPHFHAPLLKHLANPAHVVKADWVFQVYCNLQFMRASIFLNCMVTCSSLLAPVMCGLTHVFCDDD